MNNDLENKLQGLKQIYLKKLETVLAELKILFESEQIDVNELYSKVHTISGTSGMYGLHQISDISTEFEIYLKKIKAIVNSDSDLINKEELRDKFSQYLLNLEKEILKGE